MKQALCEDNRSSEIMYTFKERYAVVTFLLFTLGRGIPFGQRYNPVIPPLSWHLVPPWEYMLREIILKSVNPSPLDSNAPLKRPLDASYYGGPVAAYSDDDKNVILSRGNVYHLLNGHWILCQDGCVDCEPCAVQRNPVFTWILRRIKQPPNSVATRHDLQLTIMPQTSNHFHASNLRPNYYVYVTPQGEPTSTLTIRTHDNGPKDSPPGLENSVSEHHRRSMNSWRLTERDSSANQDRIPQEDTHGTVQETVSIEKIEKEESLERKHELENMRPRHRPRPRPMEKVAEEVNQLAPRLILGTDQKGQKHLVHVVPANYPTTTALSTISHPLNHPVSPQFVEDQATHSNNITISKDEMQTYQRIFRRVFDSLNTHRQSIENFLESSTDNMGNLDWQQRSSSDNMEASGFSWNNRDVNHKSANLELNDALLSPFYVRNEDKSRKYQQYRNRYDNKHIKQNNGYYITSPDMNQAKISSSQSQTGFNFDVDRQRRRVRIKPYFVDSKDISRINSSVSLKSLNNYLVNATQGIGYSNGFVINSAKQIDHNDTFVEKGNDNSMESSLITKQKNGQLFGSEKQESGYVNRKFEASHDAFKVITTESSVIRSKTLNRTVVL
ncbi:PREDICTED: uncharacterized protein LOC108773513 [Cyphomyrmex costatus]|uniref:uncharacterized protein LOC108773513 n=1 Tax=Cyphomyrmex costatus TaxID=456900 RepID=UPI0008523332|nr:PREDICTED: uncharacterized protein LOC108773513 [Cyphomyrmex costatus]